ncbi:MAG: hypothetical protein IPM96_17575 [Ignavibacteria bacterium]|nr:hypothetical protein [Ignavibacteria bacterium]
MDDNNSDIFYVYVYDNAQPQVTHPIEVNTLDSGGNGSWKTLAWPGWGGDKWFFLRDPAHTYLTNPTFDNNNSNQLNLASNGNVIQILNSRNRFIKIRDLNGNVTGFQNDTILMNIPNSSPLIIENSAESPPYGYELALDNFLHYS